MEGQLFFSLMTLDPGLGGAPSFETLIILSLGALLGCIVLGISGFGSSIVHLCVWAVAGGLGFDAGPLKLAVIACSWATTVSTIPLFFLTKAAKNSIKPLAISICVSKALAAPFGALLLKLLPGRHLAGIVSGVMASLILLVNKQELMSAFCAVHRWLVGVLCSSCSAEAAKLRKRERVASSLAESSSPNIRAIMRSLHHGDDDLTLPLTAPDSEDDGSSSELGSDESGLGTGTCSSDSDSQSQDEELQGGFHLDVTDGVVLIQDMEDLEAPSNLPQSSTEAAGLQDAGSSQGTEEPMLKHGFWFLFAVGSITGVCTGILGSATGIGGPPKMIMYILLNASKSAVRGTNAIMSLVQDQLIGYWVFGLLRWSDRWVYLSCGVCGAVGLLLGHAAQQLMDQRHFKAVMTMLMTLCFVMMLMSATGVIHLTEK